MKIKSFRYHWGNAIDAFQLIFANGNESPIFGSTDYKLNKEREVNDHNKIVIHFVRGRYVSDHHIKGFEFFNDE